MDRYNIIEHTLPSDSFMSCLNSLPGYFTREFEFLRLIVLAVFSKNTRQHLNPEVPTKFYRKERPHDL